MKPDQSRIFLSTLETAPWPYEVIGVISVSGGPDTAQKRFDKEGRKAGADGVIGVRFFSVETYGTGGTVTGYGTAVKRQR